MSLRRKDSSTAFFSHWFTIQSPFTLLGHAGLAGIEQVERRVHGLAHGALGLEIDLVAALPGLLDGGLKIAHASLLALMCDDGAEEPGEVVGDVVNVSLFNTAAGGIEMCGVAVLVGDDEHRGHAECVRRFEVAGDVLEHGRGLRPDAGLARRTCGRAPSRAWG